MYQKQTTGYLLFFKLLLLSVLVLYVEYCRYSFPCIGFRFGKNNNQNIVIPVHCTTEEGEDTRSITLCVCVSVMSGFLWFRN